MTNEISIKWETVLDAMAATVAATNMSLVQPGANVATTAQRAWNVGNPWG